MPWSALAWRTNWPPLGEVTGVNADLAAELVRRPGLAFADAFDLRGVEGVNLASALMLVLLTHSCG